MHLILGVVGDLHSPHSVHFLVKFQQLLSVSSDWCGRLLEICSVSREKKEGRNIKHMHRQADVDLLWVAKTSGPKSMANSWGLLRVDRAAQRLDQWVIPLVDTVRTALLTHLIIIINKRLKLTKFCASEDYCCNLWACSASTYESVTR